VELRHVLDPELVACLDFSTLRPMPASHADAELHTRIGDLRFQIDLVDGARRMPLLIVLEHQSTLEPCMPCRSLVYLGDMWAEAIQQQPRRRTVPAILPIVLAQHPARRTPRRLSDVLALTPRMRRVLGTTVELEMIVDDLSGSVLDDPVARRSTVALVEITRVLLRAHRNPEGVSPERLASLAPLFDDVRLQRNEPLGEADVRALWRYVVTVFGEESPVCTLILESVGRKTKQMYRTIADGLMAEGRAAGLSEGRAAGLSEAVLGVLDHRGLGVPAWVQQRVLDTQEESVLKRWFDRAFSVRSAEELIEGPPPS